MTERVSAANSVNLIGLANSVNSAKAINATANAAKRGDL